VNSNEEEGSELIALDFKCFTETPLTFSTLKIALPLLEVRVSVKREDEEFTENPVKRSRSPSAVNWSNGVITDVGNESASRRRMKTSRNGA
jgi:hypothetical protein